ncbi:hypothetical protein ACTMS0_28080 [Micromonospora sp. H33]|uniref:hypothetical protein n=1 Tax=Micromonospora sp. H33 TaxID=3452215 RepID=UPI003F89ADDF
MAGRRWKIEESFQAAKTGLGLDQHQNRRWISWHRWTMLVLAHAFLAAATTHHRHPDPAGLIPVTVNELRHLFDILIIEPSRRRADPTHLVHLPTPSPSPSRDQPIRPTSPHRVMTTIRVSR